jgi:hypothetical protein
MVRMGSAPATRERAISRRGPYSTMGIAMTDWKAIALARGLQMPDDQLERLCATLAALEAAFQPLKERIPHHTEPAVLFQCRPEEFA